MQLWVDKNKRGRRPYIFFCAWKVEPLVILMLDRCPHATPLLFYSYSNPNSQKKKRRGERGRTQALKAYLLWSARSHQNFSRRGGGVSLVLKIFSSGVSDFLLMFCLKFWTMGHDFHPQKLYTEILCIYILGKFYDLVIVQLNRQYVLSKKVGKFGLHLWKELRVHPSHEIPSIKMREWLFNWRTGWILISRALDKETG